MWGRKGKEEEGIEGIFPPPPPGIFGISGIFDGHSREEGVLPSSKIEAGGPITLSTGHRTVPTMKNDLA